MSYIPTLEQELDLINNPAGLSKQDNELEKIIKDIKILQKHIVKSSYESRNTVRKNYAQLIIDKKNIFQFISQKNSKKDHFDPSTNEFSILMHLVNNKNSNFTSKDLVPFLIKKARPHTDPDQSRRVKDVIKAIRKKLGKEVIITEKRSYRMDCEVVII